ncbi:hypothetical protein HYU09_04610 [Candidatus Woesearchaeota archaeon]|nr:hypothetical protein [Candidatus Woesearchaeota archaeon]
MEVIDLGEKMWDLTTLREMNELTISEQLEQENAHHIEEFLVVGSIRKDYLDAARTEIMKQIKRTTGNSFKATGDVRGGIEYTLETQQGLYMEMDEVTQHAPCSRIGTDMGFGGFNFGLYYRARQPLFIQETGAIVRSVAQSHELQVINLSHVILGARYFQIL